MDKFKDDPMKSVREELEEIEELYNISEEHSHEDAIFVKNRNGETKTVFRIKQDLRDFNKGKLIADIQVETPEFQATMRTERVTVTERMVELFGRNNNELTILPR